MGRNPTDRGRSGSKWHLWVDGEELPLSVVLAGANVHDSRLVGPTLEASPFRIPLGLRDTPLNLCLDKGYAYRRVEQEVRDYAFVPHIRPIGEASPAPHTPAHRPRRWVVERTIAWLKGFRALRTRYTCKAQNFLGFLHLVCALILWRRVQQLTNGTA